MKIALKNHKTDPNSATKESAFDIKKKKLEAINRWPDNHCKKECLF
jgi:hypothetical protein